MNGLVQLFHNLGTARVAAIGGVAVLLMGFFIFMATRLTTPDLRLLYGDLDPSDATQIVNQLSTQGVPFELRSGGTEVHVPAEMVSDLRLDMAELGYGGRILGNEIFDRDQSFGASSEQQQTNRRRALEGELARTISTFAQVRAARVHLVMPARELFSREIREPSASVILRMRGGQRLDREQVLAIQHLVATAVERLKPSAITIADDRGSLLARGGEEGDQAAASAIEMQQNYENRLARRIEELLERTVGFGKVRAEVRAEVDMSQVVQNVETFDPEGQVLRSNETIEEVNNLSDGGEQGVTVGNNLPDGGGAFGGGGGQQENSSRTEERNNFEISKTLINTVKAPGEVRSVSVAVLVDGAQIETGVDDDGNPVFEYQARTPEEMQQLEALVRSAIAYEDGIDTIEIVNMPFADPLDSGDFDDGTFFGFPVAALSGLLDTLVIGALGVLIILLGVRPLLSRILEMRVEAISAIADEEPGPQLITDQSGQLVAVAPGSAAAAEAGEEDVEAMIDIAHIEGRVKASSMKKIGEIIDKHPEEAVAILRNWMYQADG